MNNPLTDDPPHPPRRQLTFSHRVAHDEISSCWEGVDSAGVHHHLVGLQLAVHGVAGGHGVIVLVSAACLVTSTFVGDHSLGGVLLKSSSYLQHKDLWLPDEGPALISFEEGCDVLDADLAIVRIYVVVLAVAQEDQQEAVCVGMIGLGGW